MQLKIQLHDDSRKKIAAIYHKIAHSYTKKIVLSI